MRIDLPPGMQTLSSIPTKGYKIEPDAKTTRKGIISIVFGIDPLTEETRSGNGEAWQVQAP